MSEKQGTYLDTILPQADPDTKSRPEIGQRIRLSEGDISQTNKLYKCPSRLRRFYGLTIDISRIEINLWLLFIAGCGRTFQENKASFTSPVFPPGAVSEEGERCEWRITATHGERIVLNITELDVFKGENCKYDYVEIRDGYWHKSPLLGMLLSSQPFYLSFQLKRCWIFQPKIIDRPLLWKYSSPRSNYVYW